jgi:hypothetical protein
MTSDASALGAVWLTMAILAGGYARTRNRSAWTWFVLTLVLGPLAAFLLVTWPVREPTVRESAKEKHETV